MLKDLPLKRLKRVIIVIINIILVITFMQGIYNYISETNHVSRVYSSVFSICATCNVFFASEICFFTFTLAFFVVCVQCPIWLFFCSSLIIVVVVVVVVFVVVVTRS